MKVKEKAGKLAFQDYVDCFNTKSHGILCYAWGFLVLTTETCLFLKDAPCHK